MIGGKVNTTRSSAPAKSRVACAASPKPIQTLGLAVSSFALTFAAHAELGEDVFNNTCCELACAREMGPGEKNDEIVDTDTTIGLIMIS